MIRPAAFRLKHLSRQRAWQLRATATLCIAALVAALLFAAYGGAATRRPVATAAPSARAAATLRSETLIMGVPSGFSSLNPDIVPTDSYGVDWQLLFQSLVEQTPNGSIAPDLALSWTLSNGGKTVTFHMNPAARFSNGLAVTAEDAAFSINHLMAPSTDANYNFLDGVVTGVKATGPTTLVLTLPRPNRDLTVYLTYVMIIDPANVKQIATHPIGSGPYVVSSYTPAATLVLKAIPNYWGKTKPHFTYIDIEQTPDPTSAMTDLETGSLDIEWNLPYQLTATVNHIPGLQLVNPEVPGGWDLLEYDDYLPPFNNLKVRKALAYATDRATMLATAFAGQGTVATGDVPFPPGLADVTPATQPYPYSYNLAKAKALFAAAGVKTLTIWNTPSVPGFTEIGLVLQADLAKIGVTLKITSAASATTWYERFGPPPTKKWPGYFVPGGYVSHPDAGAILSQWTPYLCNCDYDNPAFTKDVQAGLATNNVAAETTAFDAAVKIFEQFLPVDIIAWIPTQLTDSKTISGAFMQGDGFPRLDDAVRTNG